MVAGGEADNSNAVLAIQDLYYDSVLYQPGELIVKYSLHVQTRISDWPIVKEFEDLGYDACWFPDTQMMWSDCYATMAAALFPSLTNKRMCSSLT